MQIPTVAIGKRGLNGLADSQLLPPRLLTRQRRNVYAKCSKARSWERSLGQFLVAKSQAGEPLGSFHTPAERKVWPVKSALR